MEKKSKGVMAFLLGFAAVCIACAVIVLAFFAMRVLFSIESKGTVDTEHRTIGCFLMVYSASEIEMDEKTFFQQVSYFASGEKISPAFENAINNRLSIMSGDYLVSLYAKKLTGFSETPFSSKLSEQKASSAIIPVFTFEKKPETLIIITSQ